MMSFLEISGSDGPEGDGGVSHAPIDHAMPSSSFSFSLHESSDRDGEGEGDGDGDGEGYSKNVNNRSCQEMNLRTQAYLRERTSTVHPKDWVRPLYLGSGLFLVLFPFWLLDSLKDPLLSKLTLNLERHQPTAKIMSVGTTLALVCFLEYIAHERRQQQQSQQPFQSYLISQPATQTITQRSDQDVLDGSGVWNRMNSDSLAFPQTGQMQEVGVPSTIFSSIGIPYCIFFGIMAYFLQFHTLPVVNPQADSGFSFWHVLAYLIYAGIESYGSLAVAAFWSYTNSTLSLEQAERFYGPIIAIAQLGAIGGSTMATIKLYDHVTLVVLACLVIILHIVVMHLYVQRFPTSQPRPVSPSRREAVPLHEQKLTWRGREKETNHLEWLTGIFLILNHNYVLLILGASSLFEVSLTCLHYQMALLGWERNGARDPDSDGKAFTQFMGRYGQLVNVSSLILSSVVFPFLMRQIGLRYTLRLFPTLLLIVNVVAFVALPGKLWVLFLSLSLLKAMTYSIHGPSTEILYLPTDPAIKFQSKFWIDVVGARIAKAFGSSINTLAGNVNRSIRVASAPSLCTAAALWLVCFRVGCQFDELIQNRDIVGGGKGQVDYDNDYDSERVSLLGRDSEEEILFESPDSPIFSDSSSSPPKSCQENTTTAWTSPPE